MSRKYFRPLMGGISKFRKYAKVSTKKGLWKISESDWISDLGRALIMLLSELRLAFRRKYWEAIHRKQPLGVQTLAQEIAISVKESEGSMFSAGRW